MASEHVRAVDPSFEPWEYGWSLTEYRRSDGAALRGDSRPVAIKGDGLDAYEECMERLLKELAIFDRWNPSELWGVVASLVVAVAVSDDPPGLVSSALEKLRNAGPSLVVLPIA